jgi:hypothetical protein
MKIRKSTILKFLSLLLFSIQLLSPIAHHASTISPATQHGEASLFTTSNDFGFISLFLMEETNNEKEGEEDENKRVFSFIDFTYIEVFNVLEKFKTIPITWSIPVDGSNAQPSLLTLLSVFII